MTALERGRPAVPSAACPPASSEHRRFTSPSALARRVIGKAAYADLVDVLQAEQTIDRERTLQILARGGYSRAPVVEDPGTGLGCRFWMELPMAAGPATA